MFSVSAAASTSWGASEAASAAFRGVVGFLAAVLAAGPEAAFTADSVTGLVAWAGLVAVFAAAREEGFEAGFVSGVASGFVAGFAADVVAGFAARARVRSSSARWWVFRWLPWSWPS